MSEKKFLNCIFIEGIILTILSLCLLIIPKLTEISFGVMLSLLFIIYGLYKTVQALINRNYLINGVLEIVFSVFILTIGVLILLVPRVSLLWIIALIGVYFILESISAYAFMSAIRNTYNFWGCKFMSATLLFLIGLFIVLGLPAMAFWMVGMLSGIAFLIKGVSKIAVFNANRSL